MDFTFTEDQISFREAISRFLMTEAAPEMLREIWETDVGRSPDLRNKIAEQGLTALSIPEAFGGLGMDDVAWALMTQELGYYAIPDSLGDTAYVASALIAGLVDGVARRGEWLARGQALKRIIADGMAGVWIRRSWMRERTARWGGPFVRHGVVLLRQDERVRRSSAPSGR